ncbi:MAG: hypothetical protein HY741_12350 [Chloroflexi bacterium]|nr:hypothetical protein [Chloroflexota bacterium]
MKLRFLLFGLMALGAMWLALAASPVMAADVKVGLLPGQTATIPMSYWCLDYGKPFPKAIDKPGGRASDEVVAVLEAAIQSGAVVSDTYQTALAIWRVRTGEFQDYANKGSALAAQIYDHSLQLQVKPIPADVLSLGDAVQQGKVSVTIQNFTEIKEEGLPGNAFHGTADVIVTNISPAPVEFVFYEGTLFAPAGGEDAQSLLAHLNPQKQPELPRTGASFGERNLTVVIAAALGLALAAIGVLVIRRSYTAARA